MATMPGKPNLKLGPADTLQVFRATADTEITKAFHELLESKHLYQNVTVDPSALLNDRVAPQTDAETLRAVQSQCLQWFAREWTVRHFDPHAAPPIGSATDPNPYLTLRSVQVVCDRCKEREAHMPVEWVDHTAASRARRLVVRTEPKKTAQVWTVSFQCQVCHGLPAVFLVRRDGAKLQLEGRSPLELLDLPKFIPDAEAMLYRDAVIAFNAGKQLAGLFYLRCTIEQFARRVAAISGRLSGEDVMEAYSATLPADLRDRMPSFRSLYERLSEALHSVRGDEALFSEALKLITEHFDIRRVFRISEASKQHGDSDANPGHT